jgi:hypothetical protein
MRGGGSVGATPLQHWLASGTRRGAHVSGRPLSHSLSRRQDAGGDLGRDLLHADRDALVNRFGNLLLQRTGRLGLFIGLLHLL